MGDMLSQAEIDALLGGASVDADSTESVENNQKEVLSDDEKDALGEIGNISMGTAATTLFTLINQKVTITTPKVKVTSWQELSASYMQSCVAIKVEYKEGLEGANLLVLKEEDVKVITDLMMGGDGTNTTGELSELHLSAISEAMNQMVGSASTSMSSMFNKKIDIMPPDAFMLDLTKGFTAEDIGFGKNGFVQISFRMEIGNLIDSEIMQLLPVEFAKSLYDHLIHADQSTIPNQEEQMPQSQTQNQKIEKDSGMQQAQTQNYNQGSTPPGRMQQNFAGQPRQMQQPVEAQEVQFQSFDNNEFIMQQKENIDLIMDVPLEVTVELGRTHKLIKEILEFGPGTIVELDKLAGEPIDVLVNGKFVAKGEVVVIDENFGIRITDIVRPENRF